MDNSFRHGVHPSIAADLEADAKLALNLVHFLISGQDQEDGSWAGAHMSMTLRQTYHALDALNLLHWDAFNSVIDNGVAWLVNLSDNINIEPFSPCTKTFGLCVQNREIRCVTSRAKILLPLQLPPPNRSRPCYCWPARPINWMRRPAGRPLGKKQAAYGQRSPSARTARSKHWRSWRRRC
jgi:hypothetical protein